jgi:hypothetical protein
MAKRRGRRPQAVRPRNLALQHLHIQHRFPTFAWRYHHGMALWHGTLQPRLTSPTYHIDIHYRLTSVPKVCVVSPPLAPQAPHLYSDGTLCLYWPVEWQWRSDTLIAETIIPWTAAWLYYYELWLDTGTWLGPSSHDAQR